MTCRIAVVDDELTVCRRLGQTLSKEGYETETFQFGQRFLERMTAAPFDVVFLDLMLPDVNGLDLLQRIKAVHGGAEVIIITGYGTIEGAVEAIKNGAYHYLTKPMQLEDVRLLARTALDKVLLRRENERLREAIQDGRLNRMVGASPAMQKLYSVIRKVAPVDCNVLLEGASGTGKALVAEAIHRNSPRSSKPFVSFNCGGFTDELISSELFGYEKGAFTGAQATKVGLLESAAGGTVFLDEIGEMPLNMQVLLLHVIQERRILRVGGVRPVELDIRLIAATNKDLKHEVAEGTFREDLFYRLNVVSIALPALSDRREDVPLLVKHFIQKYSLAFSKKVEGIEPQALHVLMRYSFPGNVRELENIVERSVALTDGEQIRVQDLPADLQELEFATVEGDGLLSMEEMEKRYILRVLEKTGYNKGLASQILGIPRTTLWRKLKSYEG
ncbi:MAG: sigma-54-dependent Fis family transcriptional regulator [Desulfovibrionaceae bacterium]|jgi:DNA-binding NtrC family response regulator|nr:sigma-54-dependent Fis family transcriptional regulator [Desulfovibrionaceae bacterium]